jgi:hypothetical protein
VDHARAALAKTAAELRTRESEVVAKDVEQARFRRGDDITRFAVDDYSNRGARWHRDNSMRDGI